MILNFVACLIFAIVTVSLCFVGAKIENQDSEDKRDKVNQI